ncbi:hypothetical protein H4Q26_009641 [Puccinia striiformis f. sp. tritici PST-130]|nr:hypothetical protein H4Q26_009641 [Puccinia striiformis f. sp. tritici PST-130]
MLLPSAGPSPRCSSGLEARAGFRLNLPPKLSYGPATEPAAVNQLRPINFDGQSLPEASPGLQSSPSSIDRSGNISPSNLDEIQASLQAIQSTFQISDDLIRRAQPLFEMTPESRSIAILLLALHNGMSPQPSMPHDAPSRPVQSIVETDISTALDNEVLVVYLLLRLHTLSSRHRSNKNLNRGGIPDHLELITKVLSARKKYDSFHKRDRADLIHNDQCITRGEKNRLAYLRVMVNLNRLKNKSTSFWDEIDYDLHNMRRKPTGYWPFASSLFMISISGSGTV